MEIIEMFNVMEWEVKIMCWPFITLLVFWSEQHDTVQYFQFQMLVR